MEERKGRDEEKGRRHESKEREQCSKGGGNES